jgi:hypothetical protein
VIKPIEMSCTKEETLRVFQNNLNTQLECLEGLNKAHKELIKLRDKDVTYFILAGGVETLHYTETQINNIKENIRRAEDLIAEYQ